MHDHSMRFNYPNEKRVYPVPPLRNNEMGIRSSPLTPLHVMLEVQNPFQAYQVSFAKLGKNCNLSGCSPSNATSAYYKLDNVLSVQISLLLFPHGFKMIPIIVYTKLKWKSGCRQLPRASLPIDVRVQEFGFGCLHAPWHTLQRATLRANCTIIHWIQLSFQIKGSGDRKPAEVLSAFCNASYRQSVIDTTLTGLETSRDFTRPHFLSAR